MSAEVNVANNNNNTTTQTASQTAQSTPKSSASESGDCKPVVVNFYIGCCPQGKSS